LSLRANIIRVKHGGTGEGSSWSNPMGDLQQAIKMARSGDEIWVAAGKYLPTNSDDRTISFVITDGVALYGGFAGYEESVHARDWKANVTILSGEIGTSSIDDNSYSVVSTENVSEATVVDGFIITGGAANGLNAKGEIGRCGGGWYNRATRGASNPTITNCVFENNFARDGAGFYNVAQGGTASPNIRNCRFSLNKSVLDGGAIYNDNASVFIEDCVFEKNEATYGAAIYNKGSKGGEKTVVSNSSFSGNLCYIKCKDIYNAEDAPIVRNCRFDANSNAKENTETSSRDAKEEIIYKSGF